MTPRKSVHFIKAEPPRIAGVFLRVYFLLAPAGC